MSSRNKPEEPRSANLTTEQMRNAIPRLKRRLEELQAAKPNELMERGDPTFRALEQKARATLEELFPPGTIEHKNFCNVRFDRAPINLNYTTPLSEVRRGYVHGIDLAVGSIKTIISLFEEKLGEFAEDDLASRARRTFGGLSLHQELARSHVRKLFDDGHFANAVEDACKILDGLVKFRSGRHDISGTDLMRTVFSPKNPVLKFNELLTESDRSEQQGLMYLYAGAMLALRNPRAHGILKDEAETAIEYIAFVNLLLRTLDRAMPY